MKIAFAIFLFFIGLNFSVDAQEHRFQLGINSGNNVSMFSSTLPSTPFLGFSAGIKGRYNLNAKWGMKNQGSANWFLESGVNYLYHGFDYQLNSISIRSAKHQVELPVYLLAKISNNRLPRGFLKKQIALVGRFGMVGSFQKKRSKTNLYTFDNEQVEERVTDKPFNLFLSGGLGLERDLEHTIIGLGLSIHGGLLNATSGTLTSNVNGTFASYDYRATYLSVDIYLLMKQLNKKRNEKHIRPSF